jgi:hypothetical protein
VTPTSPHRHPELVSGSIAPFAKPQRLKPQPHRQIAPLRIRGVDQIDLPFPPPVLELLLTADGAFHVSEHLEMDQPVDVISRRKTGQGVISVLPQAAHQVRSNPNVKRAIVPARKDVDARVALEPHASKSAEKWTLKQVQGDELGLKRTHPFNLHLFNHHAFGPHPFNLPAELVSASIVPKALSKRSGLSAPVLVAPKRSAG